MQSGVPSKDLVSNPSFFSLSSADPSSPILLGNAWHGRQSPAAIIRRNAILLSELPLLTSPLPPFHGSGEIGGSAERARRPIWISAVMGLLVSCWSTFSVLIVYCCGFGFSRARRCSKFLYYVSNCPLIKAFCVINHEVESILA